jgi:hypothetical protein
LDKTRTFTDRLPLETHNLSPTMDEIILEVNVKPYTNGGIPVGEAESTIMENEVCNLA